MTRSASPNGAVEFSYDFPFASTSALPSASSSRPRSERTRSPRTRRTQPSPARPQWEDTTDDDDLEEDRDYTALGYPTGRRTLTVPVPTPLARTGNQWRAPSPTHSHSALYPYATTHNPYASAYDYAYAAPLASSYDSDTSAISAASKRHCHLPAKIRKARRSVDEPSPSLAPPALSYSSSSSAPSSPYSAPEDDFSDADDDEREPDEERDEDEQDETENAPHAHGAQMALRRQWAALSLRVRFGVFRAKRRMRDRVLSL